MIAYQLIMMCCKLVLCLFVMLLQSAYNVTWPFLYVFTSSKEIRIPESTKFLFVESGILNTAQGIRNPTNDWNPESKFHGQRLESSTWNPESTAWNPESKTVLDSFYTGRSSNHIIRVTEMPHLRASQIRIIRYCTPWYD